MTKNQAKFAAETLADVFTPDQDAVSVSHVGEFDRDALDWKVTTSGGEFLARDLAPSRAIKRLPGWPLHG